MLIPKILAFFCCYFDYDDRRIVLILIVESFGFFREVPFWEFISGIQWTPLFEPPQYGILPLISGTLLITLIASAVAIPIGSAAPFI